MDIPKYPKMANLWKRDMDAPGEAKGTIVPGVYSEPEFESIRRWHVTEKIHGTNIRIFYFAEVLPGTGFRNAVHFYGRKSGQENIYPPLLEFLKRTFTVELLDSVFPLGDRSDLQVVLYGEGYGYKVQNWHYGHTDQSFMLFDVLIGHTWLAPESVAKLAHELEVDTVPWLGVMTTEEIIELVERGFQSAVVADHPAEGVVARSEPLMMFRVNPRPIQFKLKCEDYFRLRKVTE